MRGTIKMYNPDRHFGFIRPDAGDADTFFHISSVEGDDSGIKKGAVVDFEVGIDPRDPSRTKAIRVELVGT